MGGDVRAVLASSEADASERGARALERARDDLSVAAADGATDALDLVGADCLVVAAAHGWDVSLTESDRGGARVEFAGVRRASAE